MAIAIPKIRARARGSVPARLAAAVAALTLAAGCSAPTHSGTVPAFAPPPVPTAEPHQATMDQSVNLVVWEGYAEPQWTAKFQQQTGCHVNATVADSSDEMLALVKTGKYDAVSASGDASLRMIASGDVAPIDLTRVPNSRDIYPDMMNRPWDSVEVPGSVPKQYVPYGVPHGRGANELVYNTKVVVPAPTSWSVIYDPNSKYKGHVTYYDSPISIADAAMYLKSAQPGLQIDNPYELTKGQLQAVVNLLEAQRPILSKYWTDAAVEQRDFTVGTSVVGPAWQLVVNNLQAGHSDFAVANTAEGETGWSDTWMITSSAAHVNCAYAWINYAVSPQVNAQIAEYFGEAPANAKACEYTKNVDFCNLYHAADTDFWNKIYMWTTPTAQCGDDTDSTKVCTTYSDWVDAWNQIKQSS
jgi:putative spermidine/putrescine transport system substrate-binding protein